MKNDNGKARFVLTGAMVEESKRLIANMSIAQQQFNEFLAYCRRELKAPLDYALDTRRWELVRNQSQPAAAQPEAGKERRNMGSDESRQ